MNIQNLQKLYEVGQKILTNRLPFTFGAWECGSFACLGGWYERETGVKEHLNAWVHNEPCQHFGTSAEQTSRLFGTASAVNRVAGHPGDMQGPEAYPELQRRMEYLAGLIREAGGTVPDKPHSTKHEGLPPSVRAIFAERVV